MIQIKRIYNKSLPNDNVYLILVDRLWPRGVGKNNVRVDLWLKEIAPSENLRKWFGHDPSRWNKFKERYFAELDTKAELVQEILDKSKNRPICLLYGAKDEKHNNAVALKEFLDFKLNQPASALAELET
jgi:uncharacterized protein YeaO (DUF488 family)